MATPAQIDKARRQSLLPTHARRRTIIDAPFLARGVLVHGRSYPWAGVLIRDTVPTEGRKTWGVSFEDEEMLSHLAQEGD